jgi:hypothetical protein
MLTVLLLLGLSVGPTPDEADRYVAAHLDYMKLNYACRGHGGVYRASKDGAVRAIKMQSPSTTFTIGAVTDLDRRLQNGSEKHSVDVSDCKNLLIEEKAKLDALQ